MTGKGGDYEGWMLRLLEKPEDILYAFNRTDWFNFVAQQIEAASQKPITKAQLAAADDFRLEVVDFYDELDFNLKEVTRYRDAKGRWSKDSTDRPVRRYEIRDKATQQFLGKKANAKLENELLSRGVRKRKKEA